MLTSYWRENSSSPIISEEALVNYLATKEKGIILLSTVPSSDGETRIVQALTDKAGAKVYYCRELVEELVSIIKTQHNQVSSDVLYTRLKNYPFLIVRFVDRLMGLSTTQETLTTIFSKLSTECVVLVSGDYLDKYVPELLQLLEAEQFYICY